MTTQIAGQNIKTNTGALAQAQPGSKLLRRALYADSIFSAIGGLALVIAAQPLAVFMGVNNPMILTIIGTISLLLAADYFYVATRHANNRTFGLIIAEANVLWVIGSIVLLLTNFVPLTLGGKWTVAIVADIVAILAGLQFYAVWQMRK